jgi:hypothetical protein
MNNIEQPANTGNGKEFPEPHSELLFLRNNLFRRRIKLIHLADVIINDMKITRNDFVMVNSSLSNINLIDSTPGDLIYLLKMIVGTGGTLLMPVPSGNNFATHEVKSTYDLNDASVGNNTVNELFKLLPDTIQITTKSGSFTLWGKVAKRISASKEKNESEIDADNFFFSLSLLKAKVIGIGTPLSSFPLIVTGHSNSIFTTVIQSKKQNVISKFFEKDELFTFKNRGIPFFWMNTEKVYNKISQ